MLEAYILLTESHDAESEGEDDEDGEKAPKRDSCAPPSSSDSRTSGSFWRSETVRIACRIQKVQMSNQVWTGKKKYID